MAEKHNTMHIGQFSTSHNEEEELLKEGENGEFHGMNLRRRKTYFHTGPRIFFALSFTLILSIFLNIYHEYDSRYKVCGADRQLKLGLVTRPSYSGLEYNKAVTYNAKTDWQSENETLADEMWDSINIDSITVAISRDWAAEHGLPPSDPFYWDLDKDLYHIKSVHDMHCLKYIRYYVWKSQRENVPIDRSEAEHMGHCLDSLRQDIMCTADDTLMPSIKQGELGNKQVMQCRDYNALLRWAKDPERDSCFHQVSDYRHVEHNEERHAYCSPDSQYYEVSNKYFEIHGHRNMFSDEETTGNDENGI